MVTALKIEPDKNPCPCQLCDDGDYLNHCISPDPYITYTATALKIDNNIAAIYCRNGYMFSLPCNRRVGNKIICGVFYIVCVKDGKRPTIGFKERSICMIHLHPALKDGRGHF